MADFLRFLGEWAAASHDQLGDALAQFVPDQPYSIEMLRHDIACFRHLLGDDIDDDF